MRSTLDTPSQRVVIPNVNNRIDVEYGRVVGWGVYSTIEDAFIYVDVWRRTTEEDLFRYVQMYSVSYATHCE